MFPEGPDAILNFGNRFVVASITLTKCFSEVMISTSIKTSLKFDAKNVNIIFAHGSL